MPFCETAKGTPRLDSEMEETSPSQLTHCSIGTATMDLTQPGQADHNASSGRGHADPIGDPSVSASDRYACHSSEGHLPKSHHGSFCGGSSAPHRGRR